MSRIDILVLAVGLTALVFDGGAIAQGPGMPPEIATHRSEVRPR